VSKKKSEIQILKEHKVPLTEGERALVALKKAVWHRGPYGGETPAVWKSKNPETGKVTYVTNTHRAYRTKSSIHGAVSDFHRFIKSTA